MDDERATSYPDVAASIDRGITTTPREDPNDHLSHREVVIRELK